MLDLICGHGIEISTSSQALFFGASISKVNDKCNNMQWTKATQFEFWFVHYFPFTKSRSLLDDLAPLIHHIASTDLDLESEPTGFQLL